MMIGVDAVVAVSCCCVFFPDAVESMGHVLILVLARGRVVTLLRVSSARLVRLIPLWCTRTTGALLRAAMATGHRKIFVCP
jgi:hypothetical protein